MLAWSAAVHFSWIVFRLEDQDSKCPHLCLDRDLEQQDLKGRPLILTLVFSVTFNDPGLFCIPRLPRNFIFHLLN